MQATNDINTLIQFLQRNFYHHESLVYFADFLRLQGRFSEACEFLERCMYAFESSFSFEFQFVSGKSIELDLSSKCEPLNKTFCECLVKYVDILGRKGCNRTALEYCKLLLACSPRHDQWGTLFRMDYYALRAKESQFYLDFTRSFCQEYHFGGTLMVLPNVMLSSALAKHMLG